MAKAKNDEALSGVYPGAITQIDVAGFKSISDEQRLEIRPLTILAGANSSGKSSMMQPLLLVKQTLEAGFNPGALWLLGPNVKATSADQLLSRTRKRPSSDAFELGMRTNAGDHFRTVFRKEHKTGFRIDQMEFGGKTQTTTTLWPEMTSSEIAKTGITKGREFWKEPEQANRDGHWEIKEARSFLDLAWVVKAGPGAATFTGGEHLAAVWEAVIPEVIHVPGLRGNPERTYQPAAVAGPGYPGTFEKYVPSILVQWTASNEDILAGLNDDLKAMKLTGGVLANQLVNGVQIEVEVGRLPDVGPDRPQDRVNIADVGIGVSQILPVLVALHAVQPGRLLYMEQPETHLHPQAEFALAEVLAKAAKRGVRVVVETHSSMLLLGVQALVAEGKFPHDQVKLHWFQRDKNGRSTVTSGELDDAGAFGDWPQDFDDVELRSQKRYLDAADKRMFAR
jgi:predicted ATPase